MNLYGKIFFILGKADGDGKGEREVAVPSSPFTNLNAFHE
jgi:hypothetical protein